MAALNEGIQLSSDIRPQYTRNCSRGDDDQSTTALVPKRRWLGLTEIICNVLGTLGFVIGSLIWVLGTPTPGTLIFAASCVLCGASCAIYAVKFYGTDDLIGVYALMQQAVGCGMFTTCSFLFLYEDYATIALLGFFLASVLFLTGCILTQLQCRSLSGVMAPLLPCGGHGIIPTSLLNTLGSVLFVVGSVFLFYDWGQQAGAWCYEIGSIVFFLASWGDATVWWKLGLTPTERLQKDVCLEDEYAAVKFL